MRTSNDMIEQIKRFEGFRSVAYRDCGGVWTIGYGTTRVDGKPVTEGMRCTKEQATEWLRDDVKAAENAVNSLPNIGLLRQNNFDALVDFCYNCGCGNFHKSTLRRMIVASPWNPDISKELCKWRYATINGKKTEIAGLLKRRAIEGAWYVYGAEYRYRIKDVITWATT